MTPEAALFNRLTDGTPIAALGSRVYPHVLPQGPTYPACVYRLVSTNPVEHSQGSSGLEERRYQLDILGTVEEDVINAADAVRLRLQGFQGFMGPKDADPGVKVQAVHHVGGFDEYDDELRIHRRSLDFVIWTEVARP